MTQAAPQVEPFRPLAPAHAPPDQLLAAAFIVIAGLVAKRLIGQRPKRKTSARALALKTWKAHAPLWLRLAVPAIHQAYILGRVTGLTDAELERMATDYASSLGDELGESSADALAEGFNLQLAQKWDRELAWHRAAAAYGLDRRQMVGYVNALATGKPTADPVPLLARTFIDRALLTRADRMAEAETHTATQGGAAVAWLTLQRHGVLPPTARRRWVAAHDKNECPICDALDGTEVPLDEPFRSELGTLWSPQAHPNCMCRLVLIAPGGLSKAYDPHEARDWHGRWSSTEEAERPAPDLEAEAERAVKSPFAAAAELNPFAAVKTSPFATKANAFATANPFAAVKTVAAPQTKSIQLVLHLIQTGKPDAKKPEHPPAYVAWAAGAPVSRRGDVVDFGRRGARMETVGGVRYEPAPAALRVDRESDLLVDPFLYEDIHEPYGGEVDLGGYNWQNIVDEAERVRRIARQRAPDLVYNRLPRAELREIAHWAGRRIGDPSQIQDMIIQALDRGETKDGMGAAYLDWMAYRKPLRVDDSLADADQEIRPGHNFERQLSSYRTGRMRNPTEAYVFDGDLSDDTEFFGEGAGISPIGRYQVDRIDYVSASGKENVPIGVMGWRLIHLVPMP